MFSRDLFNEPENSLKDLDPNWSWSHLEDLAISSRPRRMCYQVLIANFQEKNSSNKIRKIPFETDKDGIFMLGKVNLFHLT